MALIRGMRGAIQATNNDADSILTASEELMRKLIHANRIQPDHVSSVLFTMTSDLTAAFPAAVRSKIGWSSVPFLCSQEIPVPGSLQRVIRVLILVDTELNQKEVQHQYLGATAQLRPDLNKTNDSPQSTQRPQRKKEF